MAHLRAILFPMPDLPWYAYALLSAACAPLIVLLEKRGLTKEQPVRFTTGLTVLAAVVSALFLPLVAWESMSPGIFGVIVFVALFSALGCALSSIAMRHLEAGEVSAILALTPAVTTMAALFLLNEVPSTSALMGVGVIVFGLIVLEFPRLAGLFDRLHPHHALGFVALAFVAVGVYTTSALFDRIALSSGEVSPFDFIVVTQVLMGLMFMTVSLLRPRERFSFLGALKRQPATIGGLVAIEFLSRVLYSHAVSLAYVGLVASLKRVSVIATIILAGRFFHEEGVARKVFAASLIIAGVTAIIL